MSERIYGVLSCYGKKDGFVVGRLNWDKGSLGFSLLCLLTHFSYFLYKMLSSSAMYYEEILFSSNSCW